MVSEFSNDNKLAPTAEREPDAHGQAAILLVESLIHGLIERKVISVFDAVEIVETAGEVQIDESIGLDPSAAAQRSITLLQAISSSLKGDLTDT